MAGSCLLALLAVVPHGLAQEARVSLDVGGSYSVPPAGSSASATAYGTAGARLEATFGDQGFLFGAGYGGLSLETQGASWISGLVGGGFLVPVSRLVSLGVSGTAEAFAVGEPLSYQALSGQLEPEIRVSDGITSLRLRGYGGLGTSDVEALQSYFRYTRFGIVRIDAGTTVATDLEAIGGGIELARWVGPVQARLELEAYAAPQGDYAAGRVGLWAVLDIASFNLELALWDTPAGHEGVATASVEVPLGRGFSTWFGGGRYGPDPLLDAPAAEGASAVFSWQATRLGRSAVPLFETFQGDPPEVSFALVRPEAESVDIAGDFTNWEPVPMVRDDGVWKVLLPVEPGAHHFAFRVDGDWFVPEDAPGRSLDEWGLPQMILLLADE